MENTTPENKIMMDAGAALAGRVLIAGDGGLPFTIVPDGYKIADLEKTLANPVTKRAAVTMTDANSFCVYAKKHGTETGTMVYANLDSEKSVLELVGVINDHDDNTAGWRNHTCAFKPKLSVEWERWTKQDKVQMNQTDFATWLEDNLKDIAAVPDMPSGTDMLGMAVAFEANAERKLKSKINLQNGAVQFEFGDEEDKTTRTRMEVFKRFTIGIPVFDGSISGYPIEARLKYRESSGKVAFWFELIRPDIIFRLAATEVLNHIGDDTGFVIVNGKP